jgi:hypothetical protein
LEKEVIIVDDGSTDGTREFLSRLQDRYLIIFHQANQGKGAALGLDLPGPVVILLPFKMLTWNITHRIWLSWFGQLLPVKAKWSMVPG